MPDDHVEQPNDLEVAFAEGEVARATEAGLPAVVDTTLEAAIVREDTLPAELFPRDPMKALCQMQALVSMMHDAMKASGEKRFIARIPGQPNPYPMVTWWTTIGLPLQLLPQIRWCRRIDTEPDSGYTAETWQARCEVVHTPSGTVVASGEGLCSGEETIGRDARPRWTDSHAIQAMSQTRAIGRTFRQCLAGLAVMAGLEATPYEEMTDKMSKGKAPPKRASKPPAAGERSAGDYLVGEEPQELGVCTGIQPRPWRAKKADETPSGWLEFEGVKGRVYTKSDPDEHGWGLNDTLMGVVFAAKTSAAGNPYASAHSVRKKEDANDLTSDPQDPGKRAAGPPLDEHHASAVPSAAREPETPLAKAHREVAGLLLQLDEFGAQCEGRVSSILNKAGIEDHADCEDAIILSDVAGRLADVLAKVKE